MDPPPNTTQTVAPAPAPSVAAAPPLPTWTKSAQICLGLFLAAGLFFMLGRWSSPGSHTRFESADIFDRTGPCLDLNRATKAELRLLPGLGEALAQRVVDHRKIHGPFRSVDDLRRVSGVGAKTLARLRPWLFVALEFPGGTDDDVRVVPTVKDRPVARSPTAGKKKESLLTGQIYVNSATQAELQKIPGIGPKISQRILDERAKAPFKSVEDLRRVPGIGAKTLEKMRPYVMIDEGRSVVVAAEE